MFFRNPGLGSSVREWRRRVWTDQRRPEATNRTIRTHSIPFPTQAAWAPAVEGPDLRPTLLHLAGLSDDYQSDGRVISQIVRSPSSALRETQLLALAYQQINSSVGQFATDTMIADSALLASGSASNDSAYKREQARLRNLADKRDALAGEMKAVLAKAAEGHSPSHGTVVSELARAIALLIQAHQLASGH